MSAKKKIKLLTVVKPENLLDRSTKEHVVIDWTKCCICQDGNNDNLICPARNKDPQTIFNGYNTLAISLSAFNDIGELDSKVNYNGLNEGSGVLVNFQQNEAKWHKLCSLQFSKMKLERAKKRFDTRDNTPLSSRSTRSCVPHVDTKEEICFICALPEKRNNKLHNVTSLELSGRVKEWVRQTNDARLLGMLQTTDLVALEAKYHSRCLNNLRNRCREGAAVEDGGIRLCEASAFADLVYFIQDKLEHEAHDYVFLMSTLTSMYRKRLAELLQIQECELKQTRSTTLREKILDHFPQLQVHRPSKEYQLVCNTTDISSCAQPEDFNEDALAFARFVKSVRAEIVKHKTTFEGKFEKKGQESSVHPLLLTCVNMMLYGTWSPVTQCKATEPALVISQLIMFNFKSRAPKGDIVRQSKDKEPPIPIYTALSAYGHTRSRKIIDDMHRRGLSVSSNRVDEITSSLCHLVVNRAEEEGLLCPTSLLKGVFTIGAYDNVDHNPSSNTSVGSFHGTSISVFQTPSATQRGEYRNFQTSYNDIGHQTRDVPHLPDSYARVPNVFLLQKEPTIPNNNSLSVNQMQSVCSNGSLNELEWLDNVHHSTISRDESLNNVSFSAFHANKVNNNMEDFPVAICALLPLFAEDSSSVSMVHHGMSIITKITKYLNPVQTPVMCCDQPLYTIGKLIQWNWPGQFGEGKFVMMFAPFHIEKAFLGLIGQYMLGCGWTSVAVNAGLATRGSADAILKGTHVKKSRAAHEITAAALFVLLHEAHNTASSDASFDSWVQEQSQKSPTFKFWVTLLQLETLLLSFVRSLREANYDLFKVCLKQMLPWFFLFDHPNYARWLSVHVSDLEALPMDAPDVHSEFCRGNFVVRKTSRAFSALAVDQAHEQHNAVVKGEGGAIGLTQDPTALRRWMLSGPEICRLLQEFTHTDLSGNEKQHHEQYPAFQNKFLRQVCAVKVGFEEFGNPFLEHTEDLVVIDTREITDSERVRTLISLEEKGNELYVSFVKKRLVEKTSSIFEPIQQNKTRIFGAVKKNNSKQQDTIRALKCDVNLFSKLFISCQNRNLQLDTFFSYENQTVPPSLSASGKMRSCQKSDILRVLKQFNESNSTSPENCNRDVYDGAALVHSHPPRTSKTFGEYCRNEFHQHIFESNRNIDERRVDIVWDLYSEKSLKQAVRDSRGVGARRQVQEDYKLPNNWSEFLKNAQNKEELFKLLGSYALQQSGGVHVVTHIGHSVKSSVSSGTLMSGFTVVGEEADARILLHVKDMVLHGASKVKIHTVDSDVVIIAISHYFILKQNGLQELWISFGAGKHHRYIPVHDIAEHLGFEKSEAMRGYHAFTGCDTVSSFSSKGKSMTWNAWLQCPFATSAFRALSHPLSVLTEDIFRDVEIYVVKMYGGQLETDSVNEARKFLFTSKNRSLLNIPPTKDALRMHTLRTAYQAGHIWGQALDHTAIAPSPSDWGWVDQDGQWEPKWTTQPSVWEAVRELVKCGCKKGCSTRCSCKQEGLPCTLLCTSCRGSCENSSVIDEEVLIDNVYV